jgi:hypothetical protein
MFFSITNHGSCFTFSFRLFSPINISHHLPTYLMSSPAALPSYRLSVQHFKPRSVSMQSPLLLRLPLPLPFIGCPGQPAFTRPDGELALV